LGISLEKSYILDLFKEMNIKENYVKLRPLIKELNKFLNKKLARMNISSLKELERENLNMLILK
jgi:hypothetical protein